MPEELLTIEDIAALLRVSPKSVRDRIVHKPGFPPPAVVIGPRTRRWARDALIAWVEQGARQSPAQTRGNRHAEANSRPGAR
jgi:predicted DNA-binding transcriptional regulator AlpA